MVEPTEHTHSTTFPSPRSESCFRNILRHTFPISVLFHIPHHALVVAFGQLLSNHLQLPVSPLRQRCSTELKEKDSCELLNWKFYQSELQNGRSSQALPEHWMIARDCQKMCEESPHKTVSVNATAIKSVILANFVKKKILNYYNRHIDSASVSKPQLCTVVTTPWEAGQLLVLKGMKYLVTA